MEAILKQKKLEYLDQMTSKLQKNHDKTLLEMETLVKLEKSFNTLKPYFKAQLQTYRDNIEHNIRVQNYKLQKEAASK
jgi:hypothetical protein